MLRGTITRTLARVQDIALLSFLTLLNRLVILVYRNSRIDERWYVCCVLIFSRFLVQNGALHGHLCVIPDAVDLCCNLILFHRHYLSNVFLSKLLEHELFQLRDFLFVPLLIFLISLYYEVNDIYISF